MPTILREILHIAILSFGTSALALLGNLAHKGAVYIGVKTHNEKLGGVLDRVSGVAQSVVKDVYNSYVTPIQQAGVWNDSTAAVARNKALNALRAYLGEKGIAEVATALGANASVTDFLATIVESAIHDAPGVTIPPPSSAVVGPAK